MQVPAEADYIKGVSSFNDRHGKLRWRWRGGGRKSAALGTEYRSPVFMQRLNAVSAGELIPFISPRSRHGTVALALGEWRVKPDQQSCTASTRTSHAGSIRELEDRFGHYSLTELSIGLINEFMQSLSHRPVVANRCLGILRSALDDAVSAGKLRANVALSVDKFDVEVTARRDWSEDDISAFYSTHVEQSLPHTAVTLMLYTGAAPSAAVRFGWHNVQDGRFRFVKHPGKTTDMVLVDIPVHPVLAACLSALPEEHGTFLQTTQRALRSVNGLGNLLQEWTKAAGIPMCSGSGIRKACARRLKEAGASEQEIAAVLGYVNTNAPHEIIGMGDRSALSDAAVAALPGQGDQEYTPALTEWPLEAVA